MSNTLLDANGGENLASVGSGSQEKLTPHAGVFGTAMNIAVQIMGLGVLQLAYMLRQGGWSCLGLMLGCAWAANFTGKLLVQCCYNDQQLRVYQSYSEIGEAAFGKLGRMATNLFENLTLFGVSALFLILAGKFLEELLVGTFKTRMWIVVGGAAVALPVLVLRAIGELKVISFVGVASVVATVLAVIVEAIGAGLDDSHKPVHTDVFLPAGFFSAFSAMALAFGCHAGLPSVEAAMRESTKFPVSFNLAFGVVLAMYVPVAVIGYAIYGDGVYSPILCSLPRDNAVQVIAKALMTAHVLLAYPVLIMLFLGKIESAIGLMPAIDFYLCKRTLLRVFVLVLNICVAVFVPYFDDMMSLIGAVCVVMTAFILPALFFIKLRAKSAAYMLLPLLVAILGTIGGSVGAVQAAIALYDKVSSGANPSDR